MRRPTIRAQFILDRNGKPKGRDSGHYAIKIHVEGAPADAHKVTYQLDPSYYDPVREALDKHSKFAEELTSYGDYVIEAKVRAKDHSIFTTRSLFDALRESHGSSNDPEVLQALADIHDN